MRENSLVDTMARPRRDYVVVFVVEWCAIVSLSVVLFGSTEVFGRIYLQFGQPNTTNPITFLFTAIVMMVTVMSGTLGVGTVFQGVVRSVVWTERSIRREWRTNTPPYDEDGNYEFIDDSDEITPWFNENKRALLYQANRFLNRTFLYYLVLIVPYGVLQGELGQLFEAVVQPIVTKYSASPVGELIASLVSMPLSMLLLASEGLYAPSNQYDAFRAAILFILPLFPASITMANLARYVSIRYVELMKRTFTRFEPTLNRDNAMLLLAVLWNAVATVTFLYWLYLFYFPGSTALF